MKIMRVWVVLDDGELRGVFSSKELACAFMANGLPNGKNLRAVEQAVDNPFA